MADIRVRIKGVDKTVRSLASISDYINEAAHDGCTEAAEHLKNKIEDKVENGVLHVTLPRKAAQPKEQKHIEVA